MKNSSLVKDVELFLDDKPNVYALRERARKVVEDMAIVSKKNESWKFTDVSDIFKANFDILCDSCNHECGEQCSCGCEQSLDNCFIKVRFCGGKLHVEEYSLPRGVRIVGLPEVLFEGEYKPYIFKAFDLEKHVFGALNGMYLEQGIVIEVDKGVKCSKPLVISYNNDEAKGKQVNIHNIILLNKEAELEVVENFGAKGDGSYFLNVVNEIYLKEKSVCKHYKVQNESIEAYHIALNAVMVYGNAKYKQFYSAKGAKISRNETKIDLLESGGEAEVYTMYKAKKDQLIDVTTNVYHRVCETKSNQYAKAVMEEGSKACFQGKVLIDRDAVLSVGNQLHKALYLSDGAELYCKPELEIYADDVKCSHGASSGEIDKEQLFYLTSRGIGVDEALDLLIKAHLDEVLDYVENKQILDCFFA